MNVCSRHCTALAGEQEVGAYGYCGLHDTWWVMTEKWMGAIVIDSPITPPVARFWLRVKAEDVPQEIRDLA